MEIQYLLWLRNIAMMLQISTGLFSLFIFSLLVTLTVMGEDDDVPLTKHKKKVFWALVVCMLAMYLIPPESYFDALIEQAVESK